MQAILWAILLSFSYQLVSAAEEIPNPKPAVEHQAINKKFEDDHVITDTKLKADAGSLSRWSLRFNLSYYGPPVGDLNATDQPNPDTVVSATSTAITGTFGVRYRFDPKESLSFYIGLTDNYPLHKWSTPNHFAGDKRFDINNPGISYDKVYRIDGFQILSSPGFSIITTKKYKNVGETYGVKYSLGTVYNIGTSGFAMGADVSLNYYLFDRAYLRSDGKTSRMALSLIPVFKYNFNHKLNINTSTGFSLYTPRSSGNDYALYARTTNQRVGLGYAITRDIYIAPYVQFFPKAIALRTTTLNISTTFSIF